MLIDVDEVARRLAVSAQTVRRLVAAGQFPAPIRVGRSVRWRLADVEAWIDEQEQG